MLILILYFEQNDDDGDAASGNEAARIRSVCPKSLQQLPLNIIYAIFTPIDTRYTIMFLYICMCVSVCVCVCRHMHMLWLR